MVQINDDPIIRSMEGTGYPPKIRYRWWAFSDDEESEEDEEDEYYGNNTENY